jgi:hypothetical protein
VAVLLPEGGTFLTRLAVARARGGAVRETATDRTRGFHAVEWFGDGIVIFADHPRFDVRHLCE